MKAAILCPGPSVGLYDAALPYDLTLAVNRAASIAPCDWWVMLDAHTFGETAPVGFPAILCSLSTRAQVRGQWPERAAEHEFRDKGDLPREHPECGPFMGLSFLTAIWLAVDLGCQHIDCYGADWSGTADFDGHTDARNNRKPDRWATEAEKYEQLEAQLAGRGVELFRVLAAEPAKEAC